MEQVGLNTVDEREEDGDWRDHRVGDADEHDQHQPRQVGRVRHRLVRDLMLAHQADGLAKLFLQDDEDQVELQQRKRQSDLQRDVDAEEEGVLGKLRANFGQEGGDVFLSDALNHRKENERRRAKRNADEAP
eukprot:5284948-Pleurochrysis_carterae.AAC.1